MSYETTFDFCESESNGGRFYQLIATVDQGKESAFVRSHKFPEWASGPFETVTFHDANGKRQEIRL